jgi:tetraacyldisaccharide 4'-kinase
MQFDITRLWYQDKLNVLLPLSWLFACCVAIRRFCYRIGLFKVERVSAPVIVVGNITVGGTGKTPFVIWLTQWLREQGYRPGIVSRGLGGKIVHRVPRRVQADDNAEQVGDEALLLVRRTACPMMVCTSRAAAARELLNQTDCNIVISDDGLQHYGLARDVEIVMVDGERRFGNGCLLPAGPLRESIARLEEVDLVVVNGGKANELTMQLELSGLRSMRGERELTDKTVHAVAAIGNPERFFQTLRRAGFTVIPHAFPDHYRYQSSDLEFNDELPIVMTTKDAVKCEAFAKDNYWVAEVATKVDERIAELLSQKLTREKR